MAKTAKMANMSNASKIAKPKINVSSKTLKPDDSDQEITVITSTTKTVLPDLVTSDPLGSSSNSSSGSRLGTSKTAPANRTIGSLQKRYDKKTFMLDKQELSWYTQIMSVLPPQHVLLTKVSVADVVNMSSELKPQVHQRALERIERERLDFIVCKLPGMTIKLAIQLDLVPGQTRMATWRDVALAQAGLELLHFNKQDHLNDKTLKRKINDALVPTLPGTGEGVMSFSDLTN